MLPIFEFNNSFLESLTDLISGGDDAQETFLERQQLKSRTYIAILEFWNELNRELERDMKGASSEEEDQELEEIFRRFYKRMREIFDEFDMNTAYNTVGIFEQTGESLSKQFFQNLSYSSSQLKEIQYELEKFWTQFFKLRRREVVIYEKDFKNDIKEILKQETGSFLKHDLKGILEEEIEKQMDSPNPGLLVSELSTVLEEDRDTPVSKELTTVVVEKVADAAVPVIAKDLAGILQKKLTGEMILDLSPGWNRMMIGAFMRDHKNTGEAINKALGLLKEMQITGTEKEGFTTKDIFQQDRTLLIKEISAAFSTTDFKVQMFNYTGVPVFASTLPEMTRKAATKFLHKLEGWDIRQDMLEKELFTEDRTLAAEAALELVEIIALKTGMNLEPTLRNSVRDRIPSFLEVPVIYDLDENFDDIGFFISRDLHINLSGELNSMLHNELVRVLEVSFEEFGTRIKKIVGKIWEKHIYTPFSTDDEAGVLVTSFDNADPPFDEHTHKAVPAELKQCIKEVEKQSLEEIMDFQDEMVKILGEIPEDSQMIASKSFLEVSHYMGKGFLRWNANEAAKKAQREFLHEMRKVMPPDIFQRAESDDRTEEVVERLKEMIRFRILWDGEKEFNLDAIEFILKLMNLNVEWFRKQDTTSLWPHFRKFVYFQFLDLLLYRLSHDGSGEADKLAEEIIGDLLPDIIRHVRVAISNELKRSLPNITLDSSIEFDSALDYDLSTFEGVMQSLFRNIRDVFQRGQLSAY